MFGLETLDMLIGLVTVYLVFGMACTAIVEAVVSVLRLRSRNLESALEEFLAGKYKDGTPFVSAFFKHPLVQALSKGESGRPSYIPSAIVGQVVEALVAVGGSGTSLAAAVNALPDTVETNRVKGLLDALVKQTGGNALAFRSAVESHFNATMDRASGWFKRHAQTIALVASTVLVLGTNLDTVDLVKSLASNPAARVKMVEIAAQRQAESKSPEAHQAYNDAVSVLQSAGLRFGWNGGPHSVGEMLPKVPGLLVSIFAVSLGAPFWFDVLQRFMQVRVAGAAPPRTTEEKK
jgi:hypothetical protein